MSISNDSNKVAKYFVDKTTTRATPAIMKKTTMQAKSILQNGYSKAEIISVIDYLINKNVEMYSLGYVSTCINDVLRKLNQEKKQETALQNKQLIASEAKKYEKERTEVISNSESTNRNKSKADRFGVQSRFGEESFSDMLERQ